MTLRQLKLFLERNPGLPDSTPILTTGEDHSYRSINVQMFPVWMDLSLHFEEYHGPPYQVKNGTKLNGIIFS